MTTSTAERIRFTQADWRRIERDWTAWWDGQTDRPMVLVSCQDRPPQGNHFVTDYPADATVDQILRLEEADLAATRWFGDAFPKWWANFGPGILAGFLGCRVETAKGTVWFEPEGEPALDQIGTQLSPANPWWQRVDAITRAAAERWAGRVAVGYTDLGGNLDVIASLRGSEALAIDLLEQPDAVEELARRVTRAWLEVYDHLDSVIRPAGVGATPWASIWSPKRCYMLQGDFAYMISPAHFDRFVVPDLVTCCGAMDHSFYHLDGVGQLPHVDSLLAIDALRGIQWIPGSGHPEPEAWLDLLARIRDSGKRVQLYVSQEGARTIVRELGGRGFALHINTQLSPHEAEDLFDELIRQP